MNYSILALLLLIFACLIPANFVCAANPLDVVISEIAWMGTETSSSDEWIELYNNTTATINITGWTLKSNDGSPDIAFQTEECQDPSLTQPKLEECQSIKECQDPSLTCLSIEGKGFYLLERTDDDAIMGVNANYIYTGALNNNGEALELRDAQGNLIDAVDCADGWLFGDNATKQTMERKDYSLSGNPDNWQTSAMPGGTPLASALSLRGVQQNDEAISPIPASEEIAALRSGSSPRSARNDEIEGNTDQLSISFPSNIFINEILPSPDGPDAENEWIEIFNQNNFSVNISNWKIADTEGSAKSYTFPQNTIIKAKSFLLLLRPQTKITLNNDSDGLNLIHPNGTITHSVIFTKAKLNQSYNRILDSWAWSDTLTPGWENIIPAAKGNTANNIKENSEIGDVSEFNFDKKLNSETSPISFTASLLALFSAFSILALKRSLNKQ